MVLAPKVEQKWRRCARNLSWSRICESLRFDLDVEAPAVAGLTLPKRDIPTPYGRPDMTGEMQVAAYAEPETAPAVAAVAAAMPKAPATERITPPAEVPVPVAAPAPEDRFPVDAMSTASIQNSDSVKAPREA